MEMFKFKRTYSRINALKSAINPVSHTNRLNRLVMFLPDRHHSFLYRTFPKKVNDFKVQPRVKISAVVRRRK